MALVDVHSHLDFKDFDKDRKELVEQMRNNNIISLTNTLNPQNYEETKKKFLGFEDTVKVCPGLYPQDAEKISDEDFEKYLKLLQKDKNKFVAIGEVGLDRHHTTDSKLWEVQEKRFRKIIELAIKIDKPIIVHTRKAEERVLELLKEYVTKYNYKKIDLHCFSGKKKLINTIRELKIYCSIPLTILNTQSFQILVENLPISQLLVETDAPFLHPSKERNSSLNIPQIYEKIAQIKGYDKKEIENIIYSNYMKFTM